MAPANNQGRAATRITRFSRRNSRIINPANAMLIQANILNGRLSPMPPLFGQ
ncbi:Hypothetical protein ETEE_0270 [Edwardsiella anguillarum ET080813]|uniref:Uncharacterized protein n=1 Tax=Edwardsiella anguillarum ET080813 TaxID=667120 RepID=A0A076LE13_9GAMM|nr:Hypothetical protein ETEE_0270 [Edwardsiella anguillarum ET080813]